MATRPRSGLLGEDWQPDQTVLTDTCRNEDLYRTDYGETKDTAKAFSTLITAVFVASITFSEKIVNFQNANRLSSFAMFVSWTLLLIVIDCA